MKTSGILIAATLAAGLAASTPVMAQPRPVPTETLTVTLPDVGTATVYAYQVQFVSADPATRRVVLETPAGRRWAVIAPPLVGDLTAIRNGQTLLIRVLPGVVTALGKAHQGRPGEVMGEVAINDGVPGWPEGFGVREVVLTSIFVDVNPSAGTVTFEGPEGLVRTVKAGSAKVLEDLQKVQPGDLAQITYLEGLAINALP